MVAKISPGRIGGTIPAIPSKSHAHRLLICAALSDAQTQIACPQASEDIRATASCMRELCAEVVESGEGFSVRPTKGNPDPILNCGESGSTYRFLLPVACALGANARFRLGGRLPERPMDALFSTLEAHGIKITGKGASEVCARGRLTGGQFRLPGNISSQYLTGLLLAAPLTGEDCEITLTTPLESRGYVEITLRAIGQFGIRAEFDGTRAFIPGGQAYRSPGRVAAEGDWSNAAFFLCAAAATGTRAVVTGLDPASPQGDRAILEIISRFGNPPCGAEIDLTDVPDLAPAIALLGAAAEGETRLLNAGRLRMKESDRIESIVQALSALGADIRAEGDAIVIRGGKPLLGGTVDSRNDHRIAMMAACAAALSEGNVTILRAEAVNKSYPGFYDDLQTLGLPVCREEA